jgi:hypothetical protein
MEGAVQAPQPQPNGPRRETWSPSWSSPSWFLPRLFRSSEGSAASSRALLGPDGLTEYTPIRAFARAAGRRRRGEACVGSVGRCRAPLASRHATNGSRPARSRRYSSPSTSLAASRSALGSSRPARSDSPSRLAVKLIDSAVRKNPYLAQAVMPGSHGFFIWLTWKRHSRGTGVDIATTAAWEADRRPL